LWVETDLSRIGVRERAFFVVELPAIAGNMIHMSYRTSRDRCLGGRAMMEPYKRGICLDFPSPQKLLYTKFLSHV
jgi:hypothetical protein